MEMCGVLFIDALRCNLCRMSYATCRHLADETAEMQLPEDLDIRPWRVHTAHDPLPVLVSSVIARQQS